MTYEEDGGPTLWIFLEERPRLRVGFQEEVGAGPSAGHVHPPFALVLHRQLITSQHPPAAMAAAGQRQQLRVPAAPTDEVSR